MPTSASKAEWAQVGIGLLALIVSLVAIYLAVSAQRENVRLASIVAAREDWSDLMNAAMDYPQFSVGRPEDAQPGTPAGERYEWYVSNILYRSESVLDLDTSMAWEPAVRNQIEYHKAFICGPNFGDADEYSERVQELIKQECAQVGNNA